MITEINISELAIGHYIVDITESMMENKKIKKQKLTFFK